MIKIVESKPNGVVEFIADAKTDVDNLPTDVGMGSNCFIIEDSSVLMFGSDGIWHYILDNSGGGGGGGEMSFDLLNELYYLNVGTYAENWPVVLSVPVLKPDENGTIHINADNNDTIIKMVYGKMSNFEFEPLSESELGGRGIDYAQEVFGHYFFIPSNTFNIAYIKIKDNNEKTIDFNINPELPSEIIDLLKNSLASETSLFETEFTFRYWYDETTGELVIDQNDYLCYCVGGSVETKYQIQQFL